LGLGLTKNLALALALAGLARRAGYLGIYQLDVSAGRLSVTPLIQSSRQFFQGMFREVQEDLAN
jgi:hypothetical protein